MGPTEYFVGQSVGTVFRQKFPSVHIFSPKNCQKLVDPLNGQRFALIDEISVGLPAEFRWTTKIPSELLTEIGSIGTSVAKSYFFRRSAVTFRTVRRS